MSPAKGFRALNHEDFEGLLRWLDSDPDRAGELYERIRWRLIAVLGSRGCRIPEELADETIDRVAGRVADIRDSYVGDKGIYFLGVMNNVHHEYLKRPALRPVVKPLEDVEAKERIHVCLDRCLDKLAPHSRQIIERYYARDKRAKIDLRRGLAHELGISAGNLRSRALRIREKLQTCIEQCLTSGA